MQTERGLTRRELLQRAAAGGVALGSGTLLDMYATSGAAAAQAPHYGGTLRVGLVGGGVTETLDPNAVVYAIDVARAQNLFDRLVRLTPQLANELALAESFEPNKDASAWTVRLRSGVIWHNGKKLTADDLIYTLKRIGAPKSTLAGKNVTDLINLSKMAKLDPLTVRLPLYRPIAELPAFFTAIYMPIVQDGETDFHHPVGTGPFEYVSFKPGQSSVFKKNPNYWESGTPYVDELQIVSITDPGTRLTALLGGQVEAIDQLQYVDAKAQQNAGNIVVLEGVAPNMVPILMAVDLEPFTDVRVRQAMRLIANRPALIESAQDGFGVLGNDLFGKHLPDYDATLPQRVQDIEKAKFLLKQAGKSGATFTLQSSQAATGMLESATVFAEQAAQAGVKINVVNGSADSYFGSQYLHLAFAQTQWIVIPVVSFIAQALLTTSPYNETHWRVPSFDKLFYEAQQQLDPAKRQDYYYELQQTLWNDGGYLIWGSYPLLDGISKSVRGVVPNPANELGDYTFRTWWLD